LPHTDKYTLHITGGMITGARAYHCTCVYCRECTGNASRCANQPTNHLTNKQTNQLINSTQHSTSWQANSSSVNQEIPPHFAAPEGS